MLLLDGKVVTQLSRCQMTTINSSLVAMEMHDDRGVEGG